MRQVAYNVQNNRYFTLSKLTITQRLHITKQDKGVSLIQYYERFKSITYTAYSVNSELRIRNRMKHFFNKSSATETAAENYCGISFLTGGDMDYYWKLLAELYNDYLSGNNRYPKSLDKAYTLMSYWKHDSHRYGRSGGGIWHTGVTFTEVEYYDKEKNL